MSKPELSVVIPSVNSYDDLHGCLDALRIQEVPDLEIIVVDRLGNSLRELVRRNFPEVIIVSCDPDTTIPRMRELGFQAVTAAAVCVIEDHVIVPPGWARQMLDALAEGHDVVGGSIENAATGNLMDWASFLCEYSGSLPPLPAGPVEGVPGNNVIYRKEVLDRYTAVIAQGKWENHLHDAMRADGIELIMRPEIQVGHKMHYTFWLYFTQRFLYSRSFAGARVKGMPVKTKLIYGAAAFALPPVLFYRTVRRVFSKRKHLGYLVKSLPLLGVFVLSWAVGEIAGYWFGAGNSLSKVR